MEKKKTSATVIADSIAPNGNRITTMLIKFPRFIEPELLRHRMFSFSAASSRAISLEKHISNVSDNPFTPETFTEDCKGMSAKTSLEGLKAEFAASIWNKFVTQAVQTALALKSLGVHKQHASRVLQSIEYTTYIVTATEWGNFFNLRCPVYTINGDRYFSKAQASIAIENTENLTSESTAQPEIQELAEMMFDAWAGSSPIELRAFQWHIPFSVEADAALSERDKLYAAAARCARISYLNHDGDFDLKKDIALSKRLIEAGHWSVFEHAAQCMSIREFNSFVKGQIMPNGGFANESYGWCANFKGFIPLRYKLENERKNNAS